MAVTNNKETMQQNTFKNWTNDWSIYRTCWDFAWYSSISCEAGPRRWRSVRFGLLKVSLFSLWPGGKKCTYYSFYNFYYDRTLASGWSRFIFLSVKMTGLLPLGGALDTGSDKLLSGWDQLPPGMDQWLTSPVATWSWHFTRIHKIESNLLLIAWLGRHRHYVVLFLSAYSVTQVRRTTSPRPIPEREAAHITELYEKKESHYNKNVLRFYGLLKVNDLNMLHYTLSGQQKIKLN